MLLLHGADGLARHGAEYRRFAGLLADRGYVVLLVHYFDSTGAEYADADRISQEVFTYLRTVKDGVSYAASRPDVDPQRIGLVGISLGASLSLSLAAQDDRVRGVVEFYGYLPEFAAQFFRRMPPTLVLHGTADRIVPVENADRIEQLVAQTGAPVERHIYAGQGHGFTGSANEDAARRTLAWLDRYVKDASVAPKS